MVTRLFLVVLLLPLACTVARAEARPAPRDVRVAVLLDRQDGDDRTLSDAVLAGADAARRHGRLTLLARAIARPSDIDAAIDSLASESAHLVVGVGTRYAEAFRAAAERHPSTRFLLLDAEADAPRVRSVTFRADEGGFLAGVVAAVESKRGRVGFVGAMETPETQAFECGWETGVRWATKERFLAVRGRKVYIGTTAEAFADPGGAEEVTREMIAVQGADVLYAAAGASGAGVIAAAREAKVKAIGIDGRESPGARDVVITSVRRRLDRAVETAIADVRRDLFDGGARVMGLANGGVDLVLPGRLAPTTVRLVEKARGAIIAGATPACVKEEDRVPAWNFPPRPAG